MVFPPILPSWTEAAVLLGGSLLVLALALYVASRGQMRRIPVLAALAMASVAVYLYGQSLGSFAPDLSLWQEWLARTWAAAALGPPLWLALTVALIVEQQAPQLAETKVRLLWLGTGVFLAAGAAFAVIGTTTDLIERWSAAQELAVGGVQLRHVPDGQWFGLFRWFALLTLLWASINVAWLWLSTARGTPMRSGFGWLFLSSGFFILGSGELAIGSSLFAVPGIVGQGTLILGMLVVGWNVAHYGALINGEVVTADFLGFAGSTLVLVCAYAAILLAFAPPEYVWLERALPVLVAVMITYVLMDTRSYAIDRLLYGPVIGPLRYQLLLLSRRIGLQPDAPTATGEVVDEVGHILDQAQQQLKDLALAETSSPVTRQDPVQAFAVELTPLLSTALKHLRNLPRLSRQHRLLALLEHVAIGATALDRAAWLRGELLQAIERLRPAHEQPPKLGSSIGRSAWLHYLVLHDVYVDGRQIKEIGQRYFIGGGSFFRARTNAIEALAFDLAQRWHNQAADQ